MTMLFEYSGSQPSILHEWISLVMLGTYMVHSLCSWMTSCRIVTLPVTHVMEFTEECLSGFWTYVHALLSIYFWLPGTWAKMTRSRWSYRQTFFFFKVTFNQESWQYVPYSVYKLIWHKSFQRIFSYLTLPILQTIINSQKYSVQSCLNRHKGSY